MVFQNYALFPHMTVAENVAFPLTVRRLAKSDIQERVTNALNMIKMGDIFAANKSFAPGDVCTLEWDPAKGLSIWAKGKLQAEPSNDPVFFRALMSIWFGQVPADWKLKDALLGKAPG